MIIFINLYFEALNDIYRSYFKVHEFDGENVKKLLDGPVSHDGFFQVELERE